MKELSIKERARRYGEALERAKEKYAMFEGMKQGDVLEDVFPELKDSNNEQIRKALIQNLKERFGTKGTMGGILDMPKVLAWLEKQYEKESVTCPICGWEIEKQCDKPKFKVGDWVTVNNSEIGLSSPLHIVDSDETQYRVEDVDGNSGCPKIEYLENHYHLWTIKDARDGDVLMCNINKAEIGGDIEKLPNITPTVCLYQNVVKDKDYIHTYCSLYNGSSLVLSNSMYYNTFVYNIHPATKEQRDTLTKAMADAGYTFDFEKKELKKIAQKPTEWHREDEQNLNACLGYIQDEFLRRWLKDVIHAKYDKTAWSEEDVAMLDSAIAFVKHSAFTTIGKGKGGVVAWLKSLKDRYAWKPSDEQLDALYDVLNPCDGVDKKALESLYEQLKAL